MAGVVHVVIPAYNEAGSIHRVVEAIPKNIASVIIVVNNGSTDNTAAVARDAGALVVDEPRRGYGQACLAGIAASRQHTPTPDIVVFIDGDFSDYPEEMVMLIKPIVDDEADLVIGSRTLGQREKGAMTIQQTFGNWLATALIRLFFGVRFTDLGPFRAIRGSTLNALGMRDTTYGWTVEMQIKAAKQKLRVLEVPVRYRRRIGKSKISGTLKGTLLAGYKILFTVFRYI